MKRPIDALRLGIIAGALAIAPAFAQSSNPPAAGNPPATSGSAAATGQTVPGTDMNGPSRTDDRDHSFNFGWLGLVGLAGLLGLRRAHRNNTSGTYDEPRGINNTGPGGIR